MTIDEAIKHCEDKSVGCSECANEHRQLTEWLKELKLLRHIYSSNVESQRSVGVNRSIRIGGKICYLGNVDFGTGLFDCTRETEIFEGDILLTNIQATDINVIVKWNEEKSNFDAKVINSSHFTVGTPSRTYMPLNKNK